MRADKFFAEKYGSRTRAADIIRKGLILRDGKALTPSDDVDAEDRFTFLCEEPGFVSRGGYKLAHGLDSFGEEVAGEVFADLGASTGGFTQVLLSRGARHVYAVDVGKAQLAPALADDARVTVMDETNARYLTRESFPERIDGVVSDVSFISLKLILPAVADILDRDKRAFVLFKPQFECCGKGLGKGGILPVRYHRALLSDFYRFCLELSLAPRSVVNAPVVARKNIEYVVFLQKSAEAIGEDEFLRRAQISSDEGNFL